MSVSRVVIIDCTALIYLTALQEHSDVFSHLRSIFSQVLIPGEVKGEYERGIAKDPKRSLLLQKIKPNYGFYSLCTRYDSIEFAFLRTRKGIDKGEAEATAQHRKVGAYCIISDDKEFTEEILKVYPNIKIISTLHIISFLELQRVIVSCDELKQRLYKIRPYKSIELRKAYDSTIKTLGLDIHKREVYRMTNFGN